MYVYSLYTASLWGRTLRNGRIAALQITHIIIALTSKESLKVNRFTALLGQEVNLFVISWNMLTLLHLLSVDLVVFFEKSSKGIS